ncbi:dihydrofolate reductase [Rhodoligotrophos defluvii]|uniref:dihydrofolate reductase n=1 Tax=Rhodoligotrophos defluvii TaxID=2561934 RepID=UPI0010C98FA4|nr:dihydrofolate reductase [Rhodoligotrophos defluvii]
MKITFVVAVAENGVIGARGGLPWHLPSDLRRFRKITIGKPVIMGRRTYESIGRPLPGRDNIVITQSETFAPEGVYVVRSTEAALRLGAAKAMERGVSEIAVIGGSAIFRDMLPLADRIYLTRVHDSPPGDVHFPDLPRNQWREVERQSFTAEEGESADTTLIVLERLATGAQ